MNNGAFGIYIKYNDNSYGLPEKNKTDIKLDDAIKIIKEKDSNKLGEFSIKDKSGKTIKAIAFKGKGNFSAYVQVVKGKTRTNHPIPKEYNSKKLTNEQVLEIISKKKTFSKKPVKNKAPVKSRSKTAKKS